MDSATRGIFGTSFPTILILGRCWQWQTGIQKSEKQFKARNRKRESRLSHFFFFLLPRIAIDGRDLARFIRRRRRERGNRRDPDGSGR
ncbi:hypothetical protein CKAN_00949200 [Cinnamomum micranthum f. kanehirae]|uniref:Uncharacterized protein n=1 Tax=Cinnamomum micranthum f. kanehirae TaxID=337451 RepID=A0A443NQN8_9MAGN|nr:hypothetical protein CKAN_00949200 [Cinnamomum micranthum f. kanehirae]